MITSSTIAVGDRLGAQLNKLALLYFFADKFNQKIIFYPELRDFGQTYQFLDYFDIPVDTLKQRLQNKQVEIYFKNTNILADDPNYYSLFSQNDYTYLRTVQEAYSEFLVIQKGKNHIHYDASEINLEEDKHYDIISGFGTYQDWKIVQEKICKDFKFKEAVATAAQSKYKQIQADCLSTF